MKKTIPIALTAIFVVTIFYGCKGQDKKKFDYHKLIAKDNDFRHIPPDTTQQILIWRAPKADDTYLNSWLDSIYKKCGPFTIRLFCGTCDSSLMLLTGLGIKTYIQGNGGAKGGGNVCSKKAKNCPPAGGGDTIYWCVNFPVVFNDVSQYKKDEFRRMKPPATTGKPVVVAVFDTGVEPGDISSYLYNKNIPSCLNINASNGWNFPAQNDNIQDDYNQPEGHGEIIARLITEQVNAYRMNGVQILPVKIYNAAGESDLYSVLCGFSYAVEKKVRIINASFGYYSVTHPGSRIDSNATLLKEYIKYYLTRNDILLVAAAGNKDIKNNDAFEKALFTNAGLPVPSDTGLRSLDTVNFYPASLAGDAELPNVIAVTTVNDTAQKVSPNQNYSSLVVDIGVNADLQIGGDYYFKNPEYINTPVRGSSFAAPIVTGIICSYYSELKAKFPGPLKKDDIFAYLLQSGFMIGHPGTVNNKVRAGVVYNNAHY